jgi:hypothetical protein
LGRRIFFEGSNYSGSNQCAEGAAGGMDGKMTIDLGFFQILALTCPFYDGIFFSLSVNFQ